MLYRIAIFSKYCDTSIYGTALVQRRERVTRINLASHTASTRTRELKVYIYIYTCIYIYIYIYTCIYI